MNFIVSTETLFRRWSGGDNSTCWSACERDYYRVSNVDRQVPGNRAIALQTSVDAI